MSSHLTPQIWPQGVEKQLKVRWVVVGGGGTMVANTDTARRIHGDRACYDLDNMCWLSLLLPSLHFRPESRVSDLREASPPASPWNTRSSSRVSTPLLSVWRPSLLSSLVRAGPPLWCRPRDPQSGGPTTRPSASPGLQQHSPPTLQSFPVRAIPPDSQILEADLLINRPSPNPYLYDYNEMMTNTTKTNCINLTK